MDTPTGKVLRTIYDRLRASYGPQHWWPAKTPTEVVVGAILTQNTAWTNVEQAIENLRREKLLTWQALRDRSTEALAEQIKPAGTYRVKARRIKAFVDCLWANHAGSLESMLDGDLALARERLLAVHGIGPETADAILLYAGNRPTFVVDTYTKRLLRRHFLIDAKANYDDAQRLFHREIRPDATLYNEFHALFVAVGKRHCRALARCDGCPLVDLPHGETL